MSCIFAIAVVILVLGYLLLVIFKWEWVKKYLIRGRKAGMYEWIEYNWGETAERLILGGICLVVLVCLVLALLTGQV